MWFALVLDEMSLLFFKEQNHACDEGCSLVGVNRNVQIEHVHVCQIG